MTDPAAPPITVAVADFVPSSAQRPLVLVVTNDFDRNIARTSREIARALERIGYHAVVRDTRLNRWGAIEAQKTTTARRDAFETAVVAKWTKLVDDYGVDLVLSVDAHWLFSRHLFVLPESRIKQVHSIWLGEVKVAEGFALNPGETLNAPKVCHHCSSVEQTEALSTLGVIRFRMMKADVAWEERLREALG